MTIPNQSDFDAWATIRYARKRGRAAQACPVGPISTEQFDAGMEEVKRMYALVVAENEKLKERIKELEANGAD